METLVKVSFPGGLAVEADLDSRIVRTDQAVASGGGGSAPEPFQLFLASIATCAGVYALAFCRERRIDTEGLSLEMACALDQVGTRYERIGIRLRVPSGFPDKSRPGIQRAMDLCAVKRHILEPPEFEVTVA